MSPHAIPTSVTFFPQPAPAPAPQAAPPPRPPEPHFVPLKPEDANLAGQTRHILTLLQGGRIDTYV